MGKRGVNRPIGDGSGEHERGPSDGQGQQHLRPSQSDPRRFCPARQVGTRTAAEAQAHEEHSQNDGEGVDRRAQHQRQQPRPDDLSAQRAHSRQRDRDVDEARAGLGRRGTRVRRDNRCVMGRPSCQGEGDACHRSIDGHRHEGRCRCTVHAQQIEPRQQRPQHGAGYVPAVEEAQPGDSLRCGLDPPGNRGQGSAHQQGRWQQAQGADDASQQNPRKSITDPGGVEASNGWHANQHQDRDEPNCQLHQRVDTQGMLPRRDDTGQGEAA